MLVIGGTVEDKEASLSTELYGNGTSIIPELYGNGTSIIPKLPEERYGHVTFYWRGNLVVCGGKTSDSSITKSCLLLAPSSHLWENKTVNNTIGQRLHSQVLKLSHGTFLLGSSSEDGDTDSILTSEFLSAGSRSWQEGPYLPTAAVGGCAVTLSDHQFLVISFIGIREFDTNVDGPSSSNGWLPTTTWPALKEKRTHPACASIGHAVVVVGGSRNEAPSSKTEIIDVLTRTIREGPEMQIPRAWFSLVTVGEGAARRVLALGGSTSSGKTDSVEEFKPAKGEWKMKSLGMATKRARFAATVLPQGFACVEDLPSAAHGLVECPNQDRKVGTVCNLTCNEEQGYRLEIANKNAVLCGWDSKWSTNAKCGKLDCVFFLFAYMYIAVRDGGWSGWGSWGECSRSCYWSGESRNAVQLRTRSCSSPSPDGGQPCTGNPEDQRSCTLEQCSKFSLTLYYVNTFSQLQLGPCSLEGLALLFQFHPRNSIDRIAMLLRFRSH